MKKTFGGYFFAEHCRMNQSWTTSINPNLQPF